MYVHAYRSHVTENMARNLKSNPEHRAFIVEHAEKTTTFSPKARIVLGAVQNVLISLSQLLMIWPRCASYSHRCEPVH